VADREGNGDGLAPEHGRNGTKGRPEAKEPRPAYLRIGCLTAGAGLVGGGMLGVLAAKIVGAVTKCTADADTGAPCDWGTYWKYGAVIGMIGLPVMAIWRLRRGRARARNSDRG
jgi:hypothetical protein